MLTALGSQAWREYPDLVADYDRLMASQQFGLDVSRAWHSSFVSDIPGQKLLPSPLFRPVTRNGTFDPAGACLTQIRLAKHKATAWCDELTIGIVADERLPTDWTGVTRGNLLAFAEWQGVSREMVEGLKTAARKS